MSLKPSIFVHLQNIKKLNEITSSMNGSSNKYLFLNVLKRHNLGWIDFKWRDKALKNVYLIKRGLMGCNDVRV